MLLMCLGLHGSLPEKKQIATGHLNCSLATDGQSVWHTWLRPDVEVKLVFFRHDFTCKGNIGSTASSLHKENAPLSTHSEKSWRCP